MRRSDPIVMSSSAWHALQTYRQTDGHVGGSYSMALCATRNTDAVENAVKTRNVVVTGTDFLVRGVVRRRRAFRVLKASSEKIGNAHAHFFDFLGRSFFCLSAKRCPFGRENRTRRPTCRPCRPTCPLSLSKKLGQNPVFELWKISWELNFSTVGARQKLWH